MTNSVKGHSLQDPFLNALRRQRVPVNIYLTNGIKLQGHVAAFDQYVVLLKNNTKQLILRQASLITVFGLEPLFDHGKKNLPIGKYV